MVCKGFGMAPGNIMMKGSRAVPPRIGSAMNVRHRKQRLRRWRYGMAALAAAYGCGGGPNYPVLGGSAGAFARTDGSGGVGGALAAGSNVLAGIVDQGPAGLQVPYVNGMFVGVTFCQPGTSNCQTVDHLLVDTGSVGVRILDSVLRLALPVAHDGSGLALAECLPFVDSSSWGTVNIADIQMGAEAASSLAIHMIGEATYPMPADCTGIPANDLNGLGANGILGVGSLLNDCGADCTQPSISRLNPGFYYGCSSARAGGCQVTSVPIASQIANPVAMLPVDNNGVILQLPAIPSGGEPSVSGVVIFGIGTQPNNGLGGATVLALDTYGYVETAFPAGGTQYTSYLDSGSNALYFLDDKTTKIPLCAGNNNSFYCPTSTVNLNATMSQGNVTSAQFTFGVANADELAANNFAFDNFAGPIQGYPDPAQPSFDWGLPFFFGRTVYNAIETRSTPSGVGPYVAF